MKKTKGIKRQFLRAKIKNKTKKKQKNTKQNKEDTKQKQKKKSWNKRRRKRQKNRSTSGNGRLLIFNKWLLVNYFRKPSKSYPNKEQDKTKKKKIEILKDCRIFTREEVT